MCPGDQCQPGQHSQTPMSKQEYSFVCHSGSPLHAYLALVLRHKASIWVKNPTFVALEMKQACQLRFRSFIRVTITQA